MRFHSVALALGWGAVFIGLVGTWVQFRRVSRLGIDGVSLATWVLFAYMGSFWITYGAVSAHSWEIVLGSLIILPLQLAIVFRLRPWREWKIVVQAFVFFVISCVVPALLWGWAGGVYGTGVAMTFNRGPQIIELIRQEDAAGVSVNSWVLGAMGLAMWVIYYSGVHLWAPLVATFFAGVANGVVALLAAWRHAQARHKMIADEVFVA